MKKIALVLSLAVFAFSSIYAEEEVQTQVEEATLSTLITEETTEEQSSSILATEETSEKPFFFCCENCDKGNK